MYSKIGMALAPIKLAVPIRINSCEVRKRSDDFWCLLQREPGSRTGLLAKDRKITKDRKRSGRNSCVPLFGRSAGLAVDTYKPWLRSSCRAELSCQPRNGG